MAREGRSERTSGTTRMPTSWTRHSATRFRFRRGLTAAAALLTLHATLLAYNAWIQSPTLNEPAHLVAGLSHWRFGRFDLFRVNPPFVRMVSALPVVAAGYEIDWSGFFGRRPGARPVWSISRRFCSTNGERTLWLITIARWACIPFSLLGGLVTFAWARELFDVRAGILACSLWCFSPNIVGHASLITADAHAASLALTAWYAFWRWLMQPSWQRCLIGGIALGLAELTKSTLVVLYLLVPFAWICHRWAEGNKLVGRAMRREVSMIGAQLLISLCVLNVGYGFEGSCTRLGDFCFLSSRFTGDVGTTTGNRFSDSSLARIRIPVPANYLQGIDAQLNDMSNRRGGYLFGKHSDCGWWYYYLVASVVKVPIGTHSLGALVMCSKLETRGRGLFVTDLIVLTPLLLIFTLVSSHTEYNEHPRYVLPCLPFAFVYLSQVTKGLLVSSKWRPFVGGAVVWSITSSLWVYPHSLSYFNELTGGPRRGHACLIHSSIDWGQDLLQLRRWVRANDVTDPIRLAYFGTLDPNDFGFDTAHPVVADRADSGSSVLALRPGWYAISVNFLRSYDYPIKDGGYMTADIATVEALSAFRSLRPTNTAGYSIYVYRLEEGHVALSSMHRLTTYKSLVVTYDALSEGSEVFRSGSGQRQ